LEKITALALNLLLTHPMFIIIVHENERSL